MWALILYDCGYELLGINAGVLSKYACELENLLKCVCNTPHACNLAGLCFYNFNHNHNQNTEKTACADKPRG